MTGELNPRACEVLPCGNHFQNPTWRDVFQFSLGGKKGTGCGETGSTSQDIRVFFVFPPPPLVFFLSIKKFIKSPVQRAEPYEAARCHPPRPVPKVRSGPQPADSPLPHPEPQVSNLCCTRSGEWIPHLRSEKMPNLDFVGKESGPSWGCCQTRHGRLLSI